ncbi:MAG: hypothetical protein AVDCRST_MAG59-1864 [uncultured Thermomicrobiales bacterium]|jgi:uncharacterized membrane protein YkvA (DUF1232 family)|uniref:DUF1232 domain-containing protein n=1 Tax=uncultured Thermomicrobiales bacterium TaxID=1645740 RepID=A0A6J4ULI5_9BACT|nr:MAG: hypothetical protein AVDCRST_MAG59-1864 [uncultured Thermomicrobiales bacterium]
MAQPRDRSPLSGAEQLLDAGMLDQIRLGWRLLRDSRVPWIKNVIPAFAALYLISPIDPIPDFLIGLGQIDDLGILIATTIATVRWLPRLAPQAVVEEHLADIHGRPAAAGAETAEPDGPTYEGRYRLRD